MSPRTAPDEWLDGRDVAEAGEIIMRLLLLLLVVGCSRVEVRDLGETCDADGSVFVDVQRLCIVDDDVCHDCDRFAVGDAVVVDKVRWVCRFRPEPACPGGAEWVPSNELR